MGTTMWALAVWIGLGCIYLVLAGAVSAVELAAAVLCATLGTALALGLRRVRHRDLRLRPDPNALLRPIRSLLPETFRVGRQLVAVLFQACDQRGAFVRQPFEPGTDRDAEDAGRRAVTVLGISLTPGAFVIRGERSKTLLLHALPPRDASSDHRWPT